MPSRRGAARPAILAAPILALVPAATAQTRADFAATAILDRARDGYCEPRGLTAAAARAAPARAACWKAWVAAGTASARAGPAAPSASFLTALGGIEAVREGSLKAGAAFDSTSSTAGPGAFPLAHHWHPELSPAPGPKPSVRLLGAWPYLHAEPAPGLTLSVLGGIGLPGQARFAYETGGPGPLAASAGGDPSQSAIGGGASYRRQLLGPLYAGGMAQGIAVRQSTGSVLTRVANPARTVESLGLDPEDGEEPGAGE